MISNKIKNILLIKDMSPSRFADEIGVQRSSISHILSGRNKPSFEVIQKIIRRFPELGMDWIMEEDEIEEVEEKNTKGKNALKSQANNNDEDDATASITEANSSTKKIEKILIFYSDKTFIEYTPE